MHARKTSGMSDEDLRQTKIYMRTFQDAICCAKDIAERESARSHYKHYIKVMLQPNGPYLLLDKDINVVSTKNLDVYRIYRQAMFSKEVADRYGLAQETIQDRKELDQRLDRAILGLETEVALKQSHCRRLLEQVKLNEAGMNQA